MAKFTKEQTQKITLSLIMLIVFVVAYNMILLKPLNQNIEKTKKNVAELKTQAQEADTQILKTKNLRETSIKASENLAYLEGDIPNSAPIAWFPLRMNDFFARHNIENISTRQAGSTPLPADQFGNRHLLEWNIDIPYAGYIPMGIAIAALENEEPLMEIHSFNITASEQNPEYQTVKLATSIVLKQ